MRSRGAVRRMLAGGDSPGPSVGRANPPAPLLSRDQIRFHERTARGGRVDEWSWAIVLLALAAVCYNGVLAFANARGFTVERAHVVVAEIAILSAAGVVILASGPRPGDGAPAALLAFFILDALVVSMLNQTVFVDMARNGAIIAIFTMAGSRIGTAAVNRSFMFAAIAVTAVLLVEMASSATYAAWFAPGDYFAQTRGLAKEEFDELGLFANALGFDSRFAIVTIMDHRACSIFLEQVSLANFGIILAILLACNWDELSVPKKSFFAALAVLILITTNSRLALALTLLTPVACIIARWWNRFLSLLIMPATLVAALLVSINSPATLTDDLPGRLNKTITALAGMDMDALDGLKALKAALFADSGYAYVIYASTILGMLALWLFVSLIASNNRPKLVRCSLLVNLYVFCSLTVSGNSVFSIKTAALLWLLVGHLRGEALAAEATADDKLRVRLPRWRLQPAMARPVSARG